MQKIVLCMTALLFTISCTKQNTGEAITPVEISATKDSKSTSMQGSETAGNIKTIPVAGNISMLMGHGGNIGVSVGSDGILIVDDQFEKVAEEIRVALGKLSPEKLSYVLNTHDHDDHIGGNAVFGKEATIIAHDNVRKYMAEDKEIPRSALPVITFDSKMSIHFNGEEIRAIYLPDGHTDADSAFFFMGSNVIHMGDTFFNKKFPFVALDSGGNVEQLAKNIKTILDQVKPDTKIIPGHGVLGTVEDLKEYHTMLVETTALVRKEMKAGKSLAQIQKKGFPAKWKSWEGYHKTDGWIETIHSSLSKNTS